jgi:hypothetical protein
VEGREEIGNGQDLDVAELVGARASVNAEQTLDLKARLGRQQTFPLFLDFFKPLRYLFLRGERLVQENVGLAGRALAAVAAVRLD